MAIGTLVLSMKSDITILQLSRVLKISCYRAQKSFSKIINLLQDKAFYYKIMLLISVSTYYIPNIKIRY